MLSWQGQSDMMDCQRRWSLTHCDSSLPSKAGHGRTDVTVLPVVLIVLEEARKSESELNHRTVHSMGAVRCASSRGETRAERAVLVCFLEIAKLAVLGTYTFFPS